MSDANSYPVDRGDVLVEAIDPPDCDDCDNRATKRVFLDLRAIGLHVHVGDYCDGCAAPVVDRLRAALPLESDDASPGAAS